MCSLGLALVQEVVQEIVDHDQEVILAPDPDLEDQDHVAASIAVVVHAVKNVPDQGQDLDQGQM